MFPVGDKHYPICLLDTMAVSEMVTRPEATFRNFLDWSREGEEPPFLPCFTVYTLIELRRKPDLFKKFVQHFHPFPCALLKGYMQLLEEEVAAYPDPSRIDPCAIAFTPLGDAGNLLSNLPTILDLPKNVATEREWNEEGPQIVAGMVSLVKNYPPAGTTYTKEELRQFVWMASLSQLVEHGHGDFVRSVHDRDAQPVDMGAFLSPKAMTYTVFHKFYTDPNRKPSNSDAFDVLITAALPYVEAIITEAHLAEALRKTKRWDDFLNRLQVFKLRDFRTGRPLAAPHTSAA
jgi:hypothetical protein